jgi:hypothetical protein
MRNFRFGFAKVSIANDFEPAASYFPSFRRVSGKHLRVNSRKPLPDPDRRVMSSESIRTPQNPTIRTKNFLNPKHKLSLT